MFVADKMDDSSRILKPHEYEDILRGDLSDIELLEDEDDDLLDEIDNVTEDQLHERLRLFETGNLAAAEVSEDFNHHSNDQPSSVLNEETEVSQSNEFLAENEPTLYNPVPRWRKPRDWNPPDSTCDIQMSAPPDEILTPKQYFDKYIDNSILENFVQQTNLYSVQQKGNSINTCTSEIEQFLGIHLMMSVVKMPSYRMYWANETRFSPVADKLSRNRFDCLRTYFHVNDNANMTNAKDKNHDKLFKVRPFIDSVRENMRKIEPDEKCSVDELIIPFKGRSTMKQYVKNKPHKWGIKVFAIASQSGIIHDFEIYVGKGTVKCTNNKLGLSGEIVLRLAEIIPKFKNYKIFCDNWFTSYHLLCELKCKGILAVGTVRSNRLCGCILEDDKTLAKKGRGSYDEMIDVENNIFACKWYDNRCVFLASSYAAVQPMDEVSRYSAADKKVVSVSRPNIVKEYNASMGGVDLNDMLVELYRINIKVRRYYLRIIFHIIDVCIVNSWLLYRRHHKQLNLSTKIIPLLNFKVEISHALLSSGQDKMKKRGRPSNDVPTYQPPTKKYKIAPRPTDDVRFDSVDHWPLPTADKQRCKNCINYYSQMKCMKCDLYLCLNQKRNCFLYFHSKK